MNTKNIGKNLKTVRKHQNMTQAELARRVGVSTDHISHAEIGVGCISLTLLIKLCNALEITPNDILAGEYDKNYENNLKNTVIPLKEINPHNRILLLELYRVMKEEF